VECHVNALAEGLEAAELAGYARGSFTGASADRAGLFESAHGGTLFLDEVGTASPRTQLLLLQLVEANVRRIGESRVRKIDVRMVFATNSNLEEMVKAGVFRADLYYRMGTLIVNTPALEEHREDIPELAATILANLAHEVGRECPRLTRGALDRLTAYEWPGNVRQLEQVLKYYMAFGKLPDVVRRPGRKPSEWRDQLDEVLARHGGGITGAARELRISRKAFYRELKRRRAI